MNGVMAQCMALVRHAKASLAGHRIGAFFDENSTCQFCFEISFESPRRALFGLRTSTSTVDSPERWFDTLAESGVRGLSLAHWPRHGTESLALDWQSEGMVGGGGIWGIELALKRGRTVTLIPRWEVSEDSADSNRPWRVSY